MIDIALVDDHTLICTAVRGLIESPDKRRVIWTAASGRKALMSVKHAAPDVLFLDYFMGDMLGLEVFRRVSLMAPKTKVIFLTGSQDAFLLRRLYNSGAHGLVLKNGFVSYDVAVKAVMAGRRYIQPDMVDVLMECDLYQSKLGPLSNKEFEIILMKLRGYTNARIAESFDMSIKAICNAKIRITKKMGATSMGHLAALLHKEFTLVA